MPRMRHPNGAGPYEAVEEQVPMMRRAGWLTREEWERAELPDWEPEPEDEQDEEPETSGEQKSKPPRRARSRATSEGNED